jgi:predicted anti-sigma-YlaC factor YlaD
MGLTVCYSDIYTDVTRRRRVKPPGKRKVEAVMGPKRLRSVLGIGSAFGFLATAGLHMTGYSSIVDLARQAPEDVRSLMPPLWVSFSVDLVVLGLIVLVAVWHPSRMSGFVVALAGLVPAIAAGLQVAYLGFIPPTAILVVLALTTWAAANTFRTA